MLINFLKDLSIKPYEVRRRIFWIIMAVAIIVFFIIWIFLIKNYKPGAGVNNSGFKMPSFGEIVPPDVLNRFNNIGNNLNSNFNDLRNNIGNNVEPMGNNYKSENSYTNQL